MRKLGTRGPPCAALTGSKGAPSVVYPVSSVDNARPLDEKIASGANFYLSLALSIESQPSSLHRTFTIITLSAILLIPQNLIRSVYYTEATYSLDSPNYSQLSFVINFVLATM